MRKNLPESMAEVMDIAFAADLQRAIDSENNNLKARFITLTEFTKRAGVSEHSIQRWIKSGKLPIEVINNQRVVKASALLRMPEISLNGEWSHQGGTIKTETKIMLKEFALAGNMSFTIDLGVRLLLGLFGLIPLKFVIPGLAMLANRHPAIREIVATQAKLISEIMKQDHDLRPEPRAY